MDFLTAETLNHYQCVVKMIDDSLRTRPLFMPEDESDTYKPIWVEEAERLRQKVEFE